MAENKRERTTEVELVSGEKVVVRAIPPFLSYRVLQDIPLPDVPTMEIASELPGGGAQTFENPDDPEYKKELVEANQRRADAANDMTWLYGLPGVFPPEDDDWKEAISMISPDFKWREDELGRRLDYIEYVFFSNSEDLGRVRKALAEMNASEEVTPEMLRAAEEAFRSKVQGNKSNESGPNESEESSE